MAVSIPWLFESEDYQVVQISSNPDYWCSNEGEFWYVNRSLGVDMELEIKKGYIHQFFEKTYKRWHVKTLMDELFGVGNHAFSTEAEYKSEAQIEKINEGPRKGPKRKKTRGRRPSKY